MQIKEKLEYTIKHNNYNNLIPKKFNYGLGILKLLLAFDVIRSHNFNIMTTKNNILLFLLKSKKIHVPCFFILSFNFVHKELISSNIKIYLKRIERLLIPYLFWPIILFLLNICLKKIFNIQAYSLKQLKNQLLWGYGFLPQFWFQWNLIFLTTFFFALTCLCKSNYLFFIQVLAFIAYIIQYSGLNKKYFNYLRSVKKIPLSRICEMIPFAASGFTLGTFKIIDNIQNYKIKTLIFCLLNIYLLEKYSVFSKLKEEIAYSGIILNIRAICLIFIFSLFSSDKINNIKIDKIIKNFTNYTGGIYYLHITIITYFKDIIRPIKNGTVIGLIIIYLICYLICFIGIQFVGNSKFKFLFS